MTKTVSHKIAVLGFLLTICLLTTYYFHFVLEAEIVFTHLFYVPIILAGLWWSRKGILVAVFLAVMLLISHVLSPLETPTGADVARTTMFVVVGAVVGILNEKRLILETKLRAYSRTLEQRVEERTSAPREAQERQRAILDGIGDAVITLDENLNITRANPIAVEQYGAVLGRKCYEAYEWLKQPCADCIARKTFADGVARSSEEEGTLKDGNRVNFVVTCSPVRDPDGEVVSVVEALHDITERKRAEEALRETTQLLEMILDHTHVLVAYMDPQFNFVRVNRVYAEADEREPSFFPGKNHFDLYPNAENEAIFRRVVETGEPYFADAKPFEYAEHPERGVSYWNWSLVPIKNPEGAVTGLVLTLVNVTERVRAEEALRESKELFEKTFNSQRDAIFLLDAEIPARIVDCNLASMEISGYTLQEMLGRTAAFLHVDEAALREFQGHLYPAIEEHGFLHLPEFKMKRKDGTVFPTEHTVIPLEDERGRRVGWVSVVRDITERKRAERTLRRSEKQASAAIEAARGFTFSYDIATGKITWGGAIEEITGYTPGEFAQVDAEGWADRIHPEDRDEVLSILQEAIETLDRATAEYRFRKKDGSYVTLASISLTERENGKSVRLVGILQDITERKRAEEELRKHREHLEELVEERTAELERLNQGMLAMLEDLTTAKERAEEADRLKTAFLATVSHELRTPLASIKGFASTLLADDVTWEPEFQRDFMETIDREADRLTELIGQLLDMSRLESGTLRIDRLLCHLADVLAQADEQLAVLAANHVLVMDVAPHLPRLNVDSSRISNVLTNLVSNAAKFAPSGTRITVTAQAGDGQVVVSVADEGPGIALEHQAHVFERFYRVDNALTRSSPGTGLGLAICKGLVEAHGGNMWVESEPGRGATFYFSLPAPPL